MKSSKFSRTVKLLKMASQLSSAEAGHQLKLKFFNISKELALSNTRLNQAEILVKHLSSLKGAAMKAGQLLSLDSSSLIPEDALRVLSQLQSDSEPFPTEKIMSILGDELGDKISMLQDFSKKPIAAASIGQVHTAIVDGQKVAVKIQYPGIKESIDSDVSVLKNFAKIGLAIAGKQIELNEAFEEMRIVLHREADYLSEIDSMQKFHQLLADDPRFKVPKAFPALSTERVITMSFEEGLTINNWLTGNPSHEECTEVGKWLLDLYCKEFSDWGLVQTDPNYSNFLIQTNPLQIILLDFGATQEYGFEFRKRYCNLLNVIRNGNNREIIDFCIREGFIDPRESEECQTTFVQLMSQAVEPFSEKSQPFSFDDEEYESRARNIGLKLAAQLRFSPPPREIMFLHRKLGGLFSLMRKMRLKIDLTDYWSRIAA